MKGFTVISLVILVFVMFVGAWCSEEENEDLAPMEKTEQEALFSAIQGFVGNWWNGSELFPDPCGWTAIQGVSCDLFDGFWYVTSLTIGPIHDNSLTCNTSAKFSPQLFDLKHLKTLSLFSCFDSPQKYPVSIPTDSWWKLSDSLESLEFRSNPGLIGQIPSSFGSLRKLQSLVLVENGLTGELPTNVGGLTQLKRLVLAGNRFTGPIHDSFAALNHLLILDLSRNSFSGPLPMSIGSLSSLLKLDLSKNFLEGKLPAQLGNLKNLTLLDLRNNNFSGGLTNSLQEMCSLEEMVLSNNPLGGDLDTLDWQNIQNLVMLDLSSTGLNGEIPESVSKLKRLRFLGLNDNKLTGNLFQNLETLPCLSALYLHGNNLTGELKFNGSFYHRMGSRFGAWNNPNLCYISALVQSRVPFGVKPCQQELILLDPNSKTSLDGGDLNHNFHFNTSLGFSSCGIDGFWWLFSGFLQLMIVLLLY